MPNTKPAVTNERTLQLVEGIYAEKALCDYGLYVGATSDNAKQIAELAGRVCGLKMYLNETFNALKMDKLEHWIQHFEQWPKSKPICVHAEEHCLAAVLFLAERYDRHIHVCHVSTKEDIFLIKAAKKKGLNVTCEVTAHHLFLTMDNCTLNSSVKGEICVQK